MEPTITPPLPTQPTPIAPEPSNTKRIIIGVIITILIIGGGAFAYSKYMSDEKQFAETDNSIAQESEALPVALVEHSTDGNAPATAASDDKSQMIEEFAKVKVMFSNNDIPGLISYMRLSVPESEQAEYDTRTSKASDEEKDDLRKMFGLSVRWFDATILTTDAATWAIEGDTAKATVVMLEDGTKVTYYIDFEKKNNRWVLVI